MELRWVAGGPLRRLVQGLHGGVTVTGLDPFLGPTSGGSTVTVSGTGFSDLNTPCATVPERPSRTSSADSATPLSLPPAG